jgi:hypothetical protein
MKWFVELIDHSSHVFVLYGYVGMVVIERWDIGIWSVIGRDRQTDRPIVDAEFGDRMCI